MVPQAKAGALTLLYGVGEQSPRQLEILTAILMVHCRHIISLDTGVCAGGGQSDLL